MPERKRPNEQIRLLKRDLFMLRKRQGELLGKLHAQFHEFQEELAAMDEEIARLEAEIDALEHGVPAVKFQHRELCAEIP